MNDEKIAALMKKFLGELTAEEFYDVLCELMVLVKPVWMASTVILGPDVKKSAAEWAVIAQMWSSMLTGMK